MSKAASGVGTVYRRDDSECWQWQFTFNGKRHRGSCETTNKRLANDYLRDRVTEICNGTYVTPNQQKNVDELVEAKLRDDKATGAKSYNTTEGRWRLHLKPFFTGMRACYVTEAILKEYRDHRLDEDEKEEVSPSTVNREFALMRNSFNQDPNLRGRLKWPMLPEADQRMGWLERHEYDAFTKACEAEGKWFNGIVQVALEYAWRKSEVRDLKLGVNVDFKANTITVGPTKNGKYRTVGMTDFIRGVLTQCCESKADGDWVFTRTLKNGKHEHVVDFRDNWDRAVKAINHPDLIFHDLRRTGACNMVEDGIPERTVMEIAGWETLTMLHRYLKARGTRDKSDAIVTLNSKRKEREAEQKNKVQENACHVSVTVEQKQGLNAEAEKPKVLQITAV
jgi:integrase